MRHCNMDLSGTISAHAMIEAFVYCSKIVINDSLSEHQDPPNGINSMQPGGAAGTWKINLEFNKIFITGRNGLTIAVLEGRKV